MKLSKYTKQQEEKGLNIVDTKLKKYFKEDCLDIGCNTGRILEKMPKGSWGIDIDDSNFDFLRMQGYKVIKTDLNLNILPLKDNSFDTIFCSHVLEHLNSPSLILKEIYRVLKPNGTFIVGVPNAFCFHRDYYSKRWKQQNHINAWSLTSMKKALQVHGFKIHRIYTNHPTKLKLMAEVFSLFTFIWEDLWFVCKRSK